MAGCCHTLDVLFDFMKAEVKAVIFEARFDSCRCNQENQFYQEGNICRQKIIEIKEYKNMEVHYGGRKRRVWSVRYI